MKSSIFRALLPLRDEDEERGIGGRGCGFVLGSILSMVLTDFSSGTANYTPQLGGTNIVKFDDFGTQDVTIQGVGAGIAGSFTIGITGADNTSYGLYSIEFNVTFS